MVYYVAGLVRKEDFVLDKKIKEFTKDERKEGGLC